MAQTNVHVYLRHKFRSAKSAQRLLNYGKATLYWKSVKLQVKSALYNVRLSRRVNSIKYFRALSRVRWFKGGETYVSRIIPIVIRQLTQGSSLMTRTEIILEAIKKT